MKTNWKQLFNEIAVIVLLAAIIGCLWNYRLLRNAYRGEQTGAQQPAPTVQTSPAVPTTPGPLPLGLMQVKELFDSREALIIDARDRSAYRAGHIRAARSLPLGEADSLLATFARTIPRDRMLVVYCNGYDCHDSMALAEKLIAAGFRQVYVFEGGYPEWRDAGYPLAKGEQ